MGMENGNLHSKFVVNHRADFAYSPVRFTELYNPTQGLATSTIISIAQDLIK